MKKILLVLITILISGCSAIAPLRDHNSFGEYAKEPLADNNYIGDLMVDPLTGGDITYADIKQRALSNCSNKGGLKKEPYIFTKGIFSSDKTFAGWWKYQCNGIQEYVVPVNNLPQPINLPPKPSVSIDQAKQQCKDLGFKPGTEKFGNCVLELNK